MRTWFALFAFTITLILAACTTDDTELACPNEWTTLRTGTNIYWSSVIECRSPDGTQIKVFDARGKEQ